MKHITTALIALLFIGSVNAQTFSGNAKKTSSDEYTLTTDSSGSIMSGETLDLSKGFDISIQVKFGFSNGNGSEGFIFMLAKNGQVQLGASGSGLGYEGIDSSLAVEFDTRGQGSRYDDPANGNNSDHIAVRVNGSFSSSARISQNVIVDNLEDNNYHTLRFVYVDSTSKFAVYLDGSRKIEITYNIKNEVFAGASTAYWGVAASTVQNFPVSVKTGSAALPVSLISFDAELVSENVVLNWSTASEYNASHFELLRSTDGKNWEIIGTVNCAGNSNSTKNYTFTDYNSKGKAFYQLKQLDFDGKFEYFRVITAGAGMNAELPMNFFDMSGTKVFYGSKAEFLKVCETAKIYFSENGEKFQKL